MEIYTGFLTNCLWTFFRYNALLLCTFSLLAITTSSYAQQTLPDQQTIESYATVGKPLSRIFTAREHGGHNQNWTSIQADDGIIYVGHTEGVTQFDGEHWSNIYTPHKTPVRSISQWDKSLYIGTTNDLLTLKFDENGRSTMTSLLANNTLDLDEFSEVWSSASNTQGVVMISTQYTFFINKDKVFTVDEAINSRHFVFSINDRFYYKPRHLPNIYMLEVRQHSSNEDEFSFVNKKTSFSLPSDAQVVEILQNKQKQLIVFTQEHGIYKQEGDSLVQQLSYQDFIVHIDEPSEQNGLIYDAMQARDGFYYVASIFDGLYVLNENLEIVRNFNEQDNISMNTVLSVNEDKQGNIWLTGIPNIVFFRPAHIISEFKAGTGSTEILDIANTSQGFFALGNGVFGLNSQKHNMRTPNFEVLHYDLNASVQLLEYQGRIVKTGWRGIVELEIDPQTMQVTAEKVIQQVGLGQAISTTRQVGKIVASAANGAFVVWIEDGQWQTLQFKNIPPYLVSVHIDNDNHAWFGSSTGRLYKIENVDLATEDANATIYTDQHGLDQGAIYIFDIDGQTIISSGGRLLTPSGDELVTARAPFLLPSVFNDRSSIDRLVYTPRTAQQNAKLWYRAEEQSGYIEQVSQQEWKNSTTIFDVFEAGGFSSVLPITNDIVYFVHDKAEIYRVNIALANSLPPLSNVNIRKVESQQVPLPFMSETNLSLSPEQRNLRFNYASPLQPSRQAIQYRTFLNDNWSEWSNETYRDFTQLPFKRHSFKVEAMDSWGRVTSTHITFEILAPWYLTTPAFIGYFMLFIGVLFGFAFAVQKWRTQNLVRQNQLLERKVAERTQEVNEKVEQLKHQQILKDRFFGNVSHEFRTPLTLTIGPLEVILQEHAQDLNQQVKTLAKTALNNASKMLGLIGQVLDLKRLEAGKLPLRVAQHDMAELLRNIYERFEPWASQQQQNLIINNCEEPLLLWFDIDQLDKCVSNLLSNAIKYSGKGTTIVIQITEQQDQFINIVVADNGVGISEDARDKVFELYYQEKSSENISAPGTGIGLAFVKEVIELHSGGVYLAKQKENLPGCTFVLCLKKGKMHFTQEQLLEPIVTEDTHSISIAQQSKQAFSSSENDDVTSLLVVDDNTELLNFISLRLSSAYRIIQASNGKEGLQKAHECLPDLIISDVSMPIMDGLSLAKSVKSDPAISMIPIILLTAKASKREIVDGFNAGADDYLTKPFDTSELIVRVNALISAQKLIRETIKQKITPSQARVGSFESKVMDVINEHLSDPEFKVESLARLLFMSRDTLIRKCKKELDETPLNLIRNVRMGMAKQLLQEKEISISEIAYACGFESLAYFSKSFKKQNGETPSEFSKRYSDCNYPLK